MMKRILAFLAALLLACGLAACDTADVPETSDIPARDNTGFSVDDVDISKLPTTFKGKDEWTPDDHFVLLGQDTAKDMAVYGLLQTKEGGAVEGDVGILVRDGQQLQLFKWSYYAMGVLQPYVMFDDLDGDGAVEIAISLHTGMAHTLNVLEKGEDGKYIRNQLHTTAVTDLIKKDVQIEAAAGKASVTWRVKGLEDKIFKAVDHYVFWNLPYDAEKTAFSENAEDKLGQQIHVYKRENGEGYELCYFVHYYVNNGSSDTLAQFDSLAADITYNADGTFTLSNYRFIS